MIRSVLKREVEEAYYQLEPASFGRARRKKCRKGKNNLKSINFFQLFLKFLFNFSQWRKIFFQNFTSFVSCHIFLKFSFHFSRILCKLFSNLKNHCKNQENFSKISVFFSNTYRDNRRRRATGLGNLPTLQRREGIGSMAILVAARTSFHRERYFWCRIWHTQVC